VSGANAASLAGRQLPDDQGRTTRASKVPRADHQLNDRADLESVSSTDPVSAEHVFRGRIIDVTVDRVVLPNGVECELEIIHHPGGAAAVAIDARQRVCLVRQYRHAVKGWLWELPAGKIDDGELHLQTAQRELREEAGVCASTWRSLGDMVSSPGVFKERVYLHLATDLELVSAELEAEEVLEVHWLDWEVAITMALDNTITDAKTVIALLRAQALLSDA
jgi:8-oxo-dGTP pyrophosphatase MutT (NUDIX family)